MRPIAIFIVNATRMFAIIRGTVHDSQERIWMTGGVNVFAKQIPLQNAVTTIVSVTVPLAIIPLRQIAVLDLQALILVIIALLLPTGAP